MKRVVWRVATALLALATATGCWDRRELNDLGIQVGTGIDKAGDNYRISVQVVIPSEVSPKKGGGNRVPVTMYKAEAPTLHEAFRKLTEISPRRIYGSHIRVLVFSEEMAREGISDVLDLLERDSEVRSDFYLMIARRTSAENVLKILTSLETIPANKLFKSLDTSAKAWAPTTTVTLDQLVEKLFSESTHPVLTGVEILGNPEEGERKENQEQIESAVRLHYSGLGVFRKDKLIGWLGDYESRGFNFITDRVQSGVGHQRCPDGGMLAVEATRSKTEMKGRIDKGRPAIDIRLHNEMNISEANCKTDLTDPAQIEQFQKLAENRLETMMRSTVELVTRKYKVDIFGFGQALYRADPKAWSRLKADWTEHFAKLKVTYKAEVRFRNIGLTNNSIKSQMRE
ncbi:Ger(x)C family spore germination protein [Paenibacillus flagellatus]|uniref:Ger(X)C family spore germination protein n=1 Tax=Paenibacillus flagellatus TaxID=2211139 RepID=A0A2V5K747_9BACL|nr:Ger(x)C family spore germination protein [Paenibacillus flagellatus]PYI55138.1 Ger(x)C family spore germination protein [Paenibacillus flagellatus]